MAEHFLHRCYFRYEFYDVCNVIKNIGVVLNLFESFQFACKFN